MFCPFCNPFLGVLVCEHSPAEQALSGLSLTTESVSFSATYSLSGEGNPDSED